MSKEKETIIALLKSIETKLSSLILIARHATLKLKKEKKQDE